METNLSTRQTLEAVLTLCDPFGYLPDFAAYDRPTMAEVVAYDLTRGEG